MGALSSFNMLAVTHHFIVQLAYIRTLSSVERNKIFLHKEKFEWYSDYEITGDDFVHFNNKDVETQYLSIMEDIGVPINLSKSVVANIPCIEYLKTTVLGGQNVSALSWRMFISNNSFMGRFSTMFSLIDRDHIGKGGLIN
jgi:hypothetical protein